MPFAPRPADNLYFTGIGDSAGNLTLNTNWGVDGSDPVANKTPTVFDDLFFDSRFDRTSSTVSIDWIGFQELKSVTVKSNYCGVASASNGLLQFKQWNGGIENPGFIVRGVFAVEGSKVFGPSEALYPLSESGVANYLGNEVRILSHGCSSGYVRNLSFIAGNVVVGGNPDGGNAKLYIGGTSRYDGLKYFTVGSLTGGGISIDATYGNAQLNLAVQGSGEESAVGNPAAKIYGAVSMVSSGNYKSQFVLFKNESVFSLPVTERFSTLQSYSDAERRANVEVGGLRSSGANNSIYAVSAPTVVSYEGTDRHFKYGVNLAVNSAASADCAYSGDILKCLGANAWYGSAAMSADDVNFTLYKKGGGTQNINAGRVELSSVVVSGGVLGISNYEGSFGAVSVESGTLSISGNAYVDSLSFAGGSVEFSEGAMLFVSGDFGAADGAGAKTEFEISASAELNFLYEVAVIDGDFGFETDSDGLVRGIDVSADNGWKADLYFNSDDRILSVMYTVPEPAAMAVLLGAFVLLLAARRKIK